MTSMYILLFLIYLIVISHKPSYINIVIRDVNVYINWKLMQEDYIERQAKPKNLTYK